METWHASRQGAGAVAEFYIRILSQYETSSTLDVPWAPETSYPADQVLQQGHTYPNNAMPPNSAFPYGHMRGIFLFKPQDLPEFNTFCLHFCCFDNHHDQKKFLSKSFHLRSPRHSSLWGISERYSRQKTGYRNHEGPKIIDLLPLDYAQLAYYIPKAHLQGVRGHEAPPTEG